MLKVAIEWSRFFQDVKLSNATPRIENFQAQQMVAHNVSPFTPTMKTAQTDVKISPIGY